jgi:hypothetical protein
VRRELQKNRFGLQKANNHDHHYLCTSVLRIHLGVILRCDDGGDVEV